MAKNSSKNSRTESTDENKKLIEKSDQKERSKKIMGLMMNDERKFQLSLALFVFFLTIISSIISGKIVYELSQDKNPALDISIVPLEQDNISIYVTNTNEAVARDIQVIYSIQGLNISNEILVKFPPLSKGQKIINLDLYWLKEIARQKAVDFIEISISNTSVLEGILLTGKSTSLGKGVITDPSHIKDYYYNYDLLFNARCSNCKPGDIKGVPDPFNYDIEFICSKNRSYVACDISSLNIN